MRQQGPLTLLGASLWCGRPGRVAEVTWSPYRGAPIAGRQAKRGRRSRPRARPQAALDSSLGLTQQAHCKRCVALKKNSSSVRLKAETASPL